MRRCDLSHLLRPVVSFGGSEHAKQAEHGEADNYGSNSQTDRAEYDFPRARVFYLVAGTVVAVRCFVVSASWWWLVTRVIQNVS